MGVSLGELEKKTGDAQLVGQAKISLGELTKVSASAGVDLTQDIFECGMEIDSSGSLAHAYSDGSVQTTAKRQLAWSSMVDSDGKSECGFFDSVAHKPTVLSLDNYRGWVDANRPEFGMTNLHDALVTIVHMAAGALNTPAILELIATKRFGGGYKIALEDLKPVQTKRIYHATIITDGGPSKGPHTGSGRYAEDYYPAIKELIVRMSYAGIFVKFIFVGNDPEGRDFLQFLDDMPVAKHPNDLADSGPKDPRAEDVDYFVGARYIDNVDKVEFPGGLRSVSDEKFAEAMTQELDTYVPCAIRRGLLATDNLVGA
jgi:hypothetical protein